MNFLFGYKMVSVLLILNTSHDIPEYGLWLRHSVSIGQFLLHVTFIKKCLTLFWLRIQTHDYQILVFLWTITAVTHFVPN